MNVIPEIDQFLDPHRRASGFDFCLPRFAGSRQKPLRLAGSPDKEFGFPSVALAERDARSAMHVISLLGCASGISEDVEFCAPEDFAGADREGRVRVLFGSRSNRALDSIMEEAGLRDLIQFQFGAEWTIIGQDGRRFSLRDPSTLDREEYVSLTDYGVIARVSDAKQNSVFLVAGLGGRATEGSGLYLRENWRDLQTRFGSNDFAVVLQFPPPFDPKHVEAVAWYARAEAFA
jgi:hypothetical protein